MAWLGAIDEIHGMVLPTTRDSEIRYKPRALELAI